MKELKSNSLLILSATIILFVSPVSGIMGNMKDDRLGPENPFHVYFTDPEYFNDAELDAENRTLYLATNYGISVKDLETGEFLQMGNWFGLENSVITRIHLDMKNERLYAVDDYNPFLYVIDTGSYELLEKYVFKDEKGRTEEGDIDKFAVDAKNNSIYASSGKDFLMIDLESGKYEVKDTGDFFDPWSGWDGWHHVQEMKYVEETGLLYLATLKGFIIYNPENDTARRVMDCEVLKQRTNGLDLDEKTGNLYIAGYRLVRYNIYTGEWMQYPYIYDDRRNHTFLVMDEYPEENWEDRGQLFRACYDPLRDEVYCQIKSDNNLIRFDGTEPQVLRIYYHDDYQEESFAEYTTCRIIFDSLSGNILFVHGRFKSGGSSSWSDPDSQSRIMWYHVDEDRFENIEIFRKNPGVPDHRNEYYWLRTTSLHDGLIVGNHESLYLLDEEMNIIRDYSEQVEEVYDMEFRGPDLYVSAENGTFILNFNNMSISRIGINESVHFYGLEIPSEKGPVYLGSAYGVHIYYPENQSLRFFDPAGNRTNPDEGNFTNFGRLAPGGIYVHPTEDLVYLYTDIYSELLELDLYTGKYTYLNNITTIENDEVFYSWNEERVGMVCYSDELSDLVIMTHHGLRNGTYEKDEKLPQTACLNSIYLDEEEDILYALTGNFPMFCSMGPIPSWPSGSPWGFFKINLENGSYDNYVNEDGVPWMDNKGFHYDEARERFYFAGGRCFYWIDKEDLDAIYEREEVPETNITLFDTSQKESDDRESAETDDDNTMRFIILVVGFLIIVLIIINLKMKRKGQFLSGGPNLARRIQ